MGPVPVQHRVHHTTLARSSLGDQGYVVLKRHERVIILSFIACRDHPGYMPQQLVQHMDDAKVYGEYPSASLCHSASQAVHIHHSKTHTRSQ